MPFRFIQTEIPDVLLIEPVVFPDDRGFFLESFKERHWLASSAVGQEVCAYVTLTTRTWDRFSLGLYVDLELVASALVPDKTSRDELSELIVQALASASVGSDVGVGLTRLPTPPESA